MNNMLVIQILHSFGTLVAYIILCLVVVIPVWRLIRMPSFVFRKVLHIVAFTCVSLMILSAESWLASALTALIIAALAYPVLAALEAAPWFAKFFAQKSTGEIKRSCLLLFFMFAVLITISWGIFDRPNLGIAAILMWGVGDGAAALVGVPFGKHKVQSRFTDGKKSWEGSIAMFLASFLSGLTVLLLVEKMTLTHAFLTAAVSALFAAATELFSTSEYDTVTVPLVVMAVLLIIG
jgi:dolichol kinase